MDSPSPVWPAALARAVLALASAAGLGACTLLPVGGSVTSSPGGEPSPMRDGLREYRAVIHCHCHLSHDSEGAIDAIARAARDLGINAVLLTDHYEPGNVAASPRGLHDGVLVVPGIEMRIPGGGSLLALGPRRDFTAEQDYAARKEQLIEDGAVLVVGHVEKLPDEVDLSGYSGFEIYNLHAEYTHASKWGIALRFVFLPPDAFFDWGISAPRSQLERWDREVAKRPLVPVTGHDAHENINVFGPLGGTLGTYAELFRLFSTRILAPELSERALLEALGRGHAYVAFDWIDDPAGFSFTYGPEAGDGAIVGDEAPLVAGHTLNVRLPRECTVRVLRDGRRVVEASTDALRVEPERAGAYRVEAWIGDDLWIVAGPIYLSAAEREPGAAGGDAEAAAGAGADEARRGRSEHGG